MGTSIAYYQDGTLANLNVLPSAFIQREVELNHIFSLSY